MRLTGKERKLLVLGVIFTAILFGMKFSFPWLGGVTGYAVYEQTTNSWDFESPSDYSYNPDLIEVSGGEARLRLQTTSTTATDALNLKLDSGTPGGVSITSLNPSDYETGMLEEDDKYYTEGSKKIKEIPEALEGLLWIKTDDSDKDKEINVSFAADRAVRVFVGHDKRGEAPYWLSRWTYWGEGIETTVEKGTPFKIYYKDFEEGIIILGSNNGSKAMYAILVNATVYESSKELVSQPYGYSGEITKIAWDAEMPEGTSVKLRIREAATEDEIEDATWSNYYTESSSEIDGQAINGFVQYETLLETTDTSKTPFLRSVTLTFEEDSYPPSAKIETGDLTAEASSWGNLAVSESLNGQSISYEYSTDSGSIWTEVISGDLSSASIESGRIRVRADMASDGLQTPSLDGVTINYTYISCEESWEQHYTDCDASNTRIKYYADANSCGTGDGSPEDNGTAESCNYCTPQWENVNSSCTASDTQSVDYYYTNICCSETGLASDCTIPSNSTVACDYCTPSISCSGYGECQSDGMKSCLSLADGNGCYATTGLISDIYSESLSEFAAECSYDSEPPVISGITVSPNAVSPGDSVTVTASITDDSSLTASVTLRNEQKNTVSGKTMSFANGSFSAVMNTSLLTAGTYRAGVSANDTNGNTAAILDAKLFTVTKESSLVKKLELSGVTTSINKTNPATNATDVFIEMAGKSSSGEVSVTTYETDVTNATKPAKEAGRYVDIVADSALQQNITNTTLRIYYSDEQISAANIIENSIRIHFYNETSGAWEALNTTLHPEQNYAEAVIYHYSTYGIFGDENQQASPSSPAPSGGTGGYGGSGGGGRGTITHAKTETAEEAAKEAETMPQKTGPTESQAPPKKETCSYYVAFELPETLNLASMTTVTGKATNTGTCDIESLQLKLTGKASELIGVKPSSIGHLNAGSTSTFNLTKLPQNIAPFQGLVVAEHQNGVTTYTGALQFEAISGNAVAMSDEIAITIELNGSKQDKGLSRWWIPAMAAVLAAAVSVAFLIRRKKRDEVTAKV